MGDPTGPPLARTEILEALARHDVEFILVGGQAGALHGAERLSYDLDICVRWTEANLDRVGAALAELDAGLRVEGMSEPFPVPHRDAGFLSAMEISTWRTSRGDVDVLRGLPGPDHEVGYDELLERAERFTVDGLPIDVASLQDVITSKETVNRPPDREALPELRALRDAAAEPSPPTWTHDAIAPSVDPGHNLEL